MVLPPTGTVAALKSFGVKICKRNIIWYQVRQMQMNITEKNGKFPSFTTARLQALPTGIVGRAGLA